MSLLNPNCSISVKLIGRAQSPLIVINECWSKPEELQALAHTQGSFIDDPDDFYPGLRKPLPNDVKQQLESGLNALFSEVIHNELPLPVKHALALKQLKFTLPFCAFSLTNQAPETLIPIQRIPHFDSTSHLQFALVSYLFKEDKGGTAFYRHKKTGYETIDDNRTKTYMKALQTEASTLGFPDATYINGSTTLFEQIHSEPAHFNTCILYPANLLHSGNIDAKTSLSSSPLEGRLTLNACLDFNRSSILS